MIDSGPSEFGPPQIYCRPSLEDVEDVEQYRRGGHHPVSLDDILNDRYKVVHKLGHGGFATIWLARVLDENRYVAIKIISANASSRDLEFLTYLQEHGGNHPNIVSLQHSFKVQGPNGLHQCLVFDTAGPSLKRITDDQHQLSAVVARKAAQQVAEGLAHLHSAGIGHGDLTASNILFELKDFNGWSELELYQHLGKPRTARVRLLSGASPGPSAPGKVVEAIQYSNIDEKWLTGNVRIIDFGEAFFIKAPPAGFLGTPAAYFAPEMLFGMSASAASDVWALGCVIFELLASRPLIYVFFQRLDEALAEVVHTLGPLPRVWQHSYNDGSLEKRDPKPGQNDPWFDSLELRHPLESLVRQIEPRLTAEEVAVFLNLLKGALEYEPSQRISAKQIATHTWLSHDGANDLR